MSYKTIVVTGGAGFIGSHLVDRLLLSGIRVIAIDNFEPFYAREFKENNLVEARQKYSEDEFLFVEANILHHESILSLLQREKPNAIVHLAALAGVRPSIERPKAYSDVNVGGTVALLEIAKSVGVESFVLGSSSSIYGANTKVPFSESDDVSCQISPYGASKRAAELFCFPFHKNCNLKTACLRFFTVYGPRQRPDLAIHKFVKLMHEGKPIPFFGDGSSRRDYTYVDDIVDGIIRSLAWLEASPSPVFEIFNLGNSNPLSLKELVGLLEELTGIKGILDSKPAQEGDMEVTYADISKSIRILGYNPKTSMREGLGHFIRWYKSSNVGL